MKILPLFKSHYSIGRSILTLERSGNKRSDYPISIFDLAKEADLQEIILIDNSFSGFLEAYTNSQEEKIKLIFGLRVTMCCDIEKKSDDEISKQHKIVILAKNTEGYKRLIKISTLACLKGFYYEPRIDFKSVVKEWDNNDLQLAIPFYDSFLFYNALYGRRCVPDFSFTTPVFFIEHNFLPFDSLIEKTILSYSKTEFEVIPTKTICYSTRKDFLAYLTFRCINNRSMNSKITLNEPNQEHLSSAEFCFEAWKESNEKNG